MKKTCLLCGHVKASYLATAEAGFVLTLRWWHNPSSKLADMENTPVLSSAFKRLQQVRNRGEQSYAIQDTKTSWLGHCVAVCGLNLKIILMLLPVLILSEFYLLRQLCFPLSILPVYKDEIPRVKYPDGRASPAVSTFYWQLTEKEVEIFARRNVAGFTFHLIEESV